MDRISHRVDYVDTQPLTASQREAIWPYRIELAPESAYSKRYVYIADASPCLDEQAYEMALELQRFCAGESNTFHISQVGALVSVMSRWGAQSNAATRKALDAELREWTESVKPGGERPIRLLPEGLYLDAGKFGCYILSGPLLEAYRFQCGLMSSVNRNVTIDGRPSGIAYRAREIPDLLRHLNSAERRVLHQYGPEPRLQNTNFRLGKDGRWYITGDDFDLLAHVGNMWVDGLDIHDGEVISEVQLLGADMRAIEARRATFQELEAQYREPGRRDALETFIKEHAADIAYPGVSIDGASLPVLLLTLPQDTQELGDMDELWSEMSPKDGCRRFAYMLPNAEDGGSDPFEKPLLDIANRLEAMQALRLLSMANGTLEHRMLDDLLRTIGKAVPRSTESRKRAMAAYGAELDKILTAVSVKYPELASVDETSATPEPAAQSADTTDPFTPAADTLVLGRDARIDLPAQMAPPARTGLMDRLRMGLRRVMGETA